MIHVNKKIMAEDEIRELKIALVRAIDFATEQATDCGAALLSNELHAGFNFSFTIAGDKRMTVKLSIDISEDAAPF